jgi:hypothetical protein
MTDPISTAEAIKLANDAVKIIKNTETGKSLLNTLGYYLGGKNLEISKAKNRGKAKAREKGEEEMETMRIEFYEKPMLQKNLIEKLENSHNQFKWGNLFSTIGKAGKYLKPSASGEPDADNLHLLFDEAKLRSKENMQEYIAQLLASEVNEPNSISRQTIKKVQEMDATDFELFAKYASLCFLDFIPHDYFAIENIENTNNCKHYYQDIQKLLSLGLFFSSVNDVYVIYDDKNKDQTKENYKYFDEEIILISSDKLQFRNYYNLTPVGKELLPFLDLKYNNEFFQWLIKWIEAKGYKVEIISPKK